MSPLVRIRRHFLVETICALFGESRVGFVGAMLQWLAIVIVLAYPKLLVSLASWHLALMSLGIVALIAGLVLAIRGNSLGPMIVIPAFVGFGLLLILTALLYPLRFLIKEEPSEAKDATTQSGPIHSELD